MTCVWIDKYHIQLNVDAVKIEAELAKICFTILRGSDEQFSLKMCSPSDQNGSPSPLFFVIDFEVSQKHNYSFQPPISGLLLLALGR